MDVPSGKIFHVRDCFSKKLEEINFRDYKKRKIRIFILLFVLHNYKNFIYRLIFQKNISMNVPSGKLFCIRGVIVQDFLGKINFQDYKKRKIILEFLFFCSLQLQKYHLQINFPKKYFHGCSMRQNIPRKGLFLEETEIQSKNRLFPSNYRRMITR